MNNKKVELLAPAGDMDKLKTAILFGADAVYLAGNAFGLRSKSKNFSIEQIEEAVKFAHERNVKVYVTCNIFARNGDFNKLGEYAKQLEKANVDAVLVADPGIFYVIKNAAPKLDIHISTQANTTNYQTVNFWKKAGASRVVTARELSLKELEFITQNLEEPTEIEAFIHGAMCMAYSGRCLLSNYFTSRDSNKGACSHACRWRYYIVEENRPNEYYPIEEDDAGTYIFNSKDLCMIYHIPELIKSGVYSFKIEGRAKSCYYVGSVVKIYREAIDDYLKDPKLYESKKDYYLEEINKTSNRGYTTGFFFRRTNETDQIYTKNSYVRTTDFIGVVREYDKETGFATIEQRNKFVVGETVEFVTINGKNFSQTVDEMYDMDGNSLTEAPHPQQIIKLKVLQPVSVYDLMRKDSDNPVFLE